MDEDQVLYENIWEMLLSGQPSLILQGFNALLPDQQEGAREHLVKMVSEPGWQPEQRVSAKSALDTIAELEE